MKEFLEGCAFYVRALGRKAHQCKALYDFYDDNDHDCTECPFFRDIDTYEPSPRRMRARL